LSFQNDDIVYKLQKEQLIISVIQSYFQLWQALNDLKTQTISFLRILGTNLDSTLQLYQHIEVDSISFTLNKLPRRKRSGYPIPNTLKRYAASGGKLDS
jgi:hypothetical protein